MPWWIVWTSIRVHAWCSASCESERGLTQDDIDVGLLEVINDIIMDENDDEFETGEETLANFVDTIPNEYIIL